MRILQPLGDPDSVLARRNAFAKVVAVVLLTSLLVASIDPVTPAVALAAELAVVPLAGIGYRDLARRAVPVLIGAAGVFVFTLIFTTADNRLLAALGLTLRLFALALPGLLVVASTDPTDLADALIKHARVPPRFAIGALAAFRLVPLLGAEWEALSLARRARGIDAGRNPIAKLRIFASVTFALLVGAIRWGTRLATAMDARGFDARVPRTMARPPHFGAADALLIVAAAAIAATALTVSLVTGTFRPLL